MESKNHLLHPHGELSGIEVINNFIEDNLRRLNRVLEGIEDHGLHWKIDSKANSISVIIWHMGRFLDVFFTRFVKGLQVEDECWFVDGWADKTGYDPRGIGRDGWGSLNEYTPDEVSEIPRLTKEVIIGYITQVYENVREYLQSTSMAELVEPGYGFDSAYTRYQVLTMAILDNVRHLGEIRLIRSLWERSGT